MPLWVSDFLSSPAVMAMSNAQVGSYLLLLMAQWSSADDRIPERHVRQIARWRGSGEALREVLSLFQHDSGFFFHKKLRQIRSEREAFSEARQDAGSRGGSAKAQLRSSSSSATASYAGAGEGEGESPDGISEGGEPTPGPLRAEDVPIPPELDTPEFRKAWLERWLPWRRSREGRNKPVSVGAAKAQLAKLAPCGPGQACLAIAASISNDWQGLFPEPANGSSPVKPRFAGSTVSPETQRELERMKAEKVGAGKS